MSAYSLVRFDFGRTTWRGARLLVGSVSSALIFASIIVGVDVSVATARSGAALSGNSSAQIANRMNKGDRQQIAPASRHIAERQLGEFEASPAPAPDTKLAIGCESLISPLANPLFARVARRCLS